MKFNARFNIFGTIGNGGELWATLRKSPSHSFHVRTRNPDGQIERAIRYDRDVAIDTAGRIAEREILNTVTVTKKPIFRQEAA